MQKILLVMVFRNRSMALRPIHRIKHVFDSQFATAAGTAVNVALITTVDAPVLGTPDEVETGSKVNGIYLKVEVNATSSGALANFYMVVWKNPGGNLANIVPNTVGTNDNKRFAIHQEMVMLQKEPTADSLGGNPRTVFNGVIVIPRGYRRFGPNDLLTISVLSPGTSCDVCLQCHYKEFR